jgi:hypothetical protein
MAAIAWWFTTQVHGCGWRFECSVAVGSDLSVPLAKEGWWAGDLGSGDERAGIAGGRGGVEDEGAPAADVEKDIEEKRFAHFGGGTRCNFTGSSPEASFSALLSFSYNDGFRQLLRVRKMTAVCLFEFPLVWCGSCSEV